MNSEFYRSFIKTSLVVVVVVVAALAVSHFTDPLQMAMPGARAQQINCVNNLKQIGLSFRQWALDNGDQYPFNLSTNDGGTRELCAIGGDGFDHNAAFHLLVMSNELSTPRILVCPQDRSKKAAADFSRLRPDNVTYQLHSGPEVNETNQAAVMMVCPVEGNTLKCDGTVTKGKKR